MSDDIEAGEMQPESGSETMEVADVAYRLSPLGDVVRSTVWAYKELINSDLLEFDSNGGEVLPRSDVLKAAQALAVTAFIQREQEARRKQPAAPATNRRTDSRPAPADSGARAPRQAQGGGGQRTKRPRNKKAYCGCGHDNFTLYGVDYRGSDCDPSECRSEYQGEDQGPCGCIQPSPLMDGEVVMQMQGGNWRWVEINVPEEVS